MGLSGDLLVQLKGNKQMHKQCRSKDRCPAKSIGMLSSCVRDGVRKTVAKMEVNMARDTKKSKKWLYSYVSQKRKVRENVPQLMKW